MDEIETRGPMSPKETEARLKRERAPDWRLLITSTSSRLLPPRSHVNNEEFLHNVPVPQELCGPRQSRDIPCTTAFPLLYSGNNSNWWK